MHRLPRFLSLAAVVFLLSSLTSCSPGGGGQAQAQQKPEYDQMKSMVLDVLHSKEGVDTLKDIAKEPSFKKTIIVTDQDVTSAIQKTLNEDKKQIQIMEAQMKDPKFAAAMVKASKKEHETLLKNLMKDPDYQSAMLTLMKSPEYQKMVLTVMQSPEYRQQVMKIMADSLQNPEFKLVFMDIVKEAIQSGAGVSKTQGGKEGGGKEGGGEGGQEGDSEQKEKKEEE